MKSLTSKVVVVTGASAGVGRAAAIAFGREGCHVALLARDSARLDRAVREVIGAGGKAIAIPTDVADAEAVEAAADIVERELGPIDIWVNDAMATIFGPVGEVSANELKRATEVTYLGSAYGAMTALHRMRKRGSGTIVQVGSALAYRAIPLQAPYCAAKYAIRGFVEALRAELIHDNSPIRVSMVQLAAFNTPQFDWARNRVHKMPQPVPPIFQPEVAARAIVWTACHRRRELWVGWPTVKMILGTRIAPWFAERFVARNAYEAQLTDREVEPGYCDNLFSPVSGHFGSHGRFDRQARGHSLQLWLATHRRATMVGVSVIFLVVIAGIIAIALSG